MPNPGSQRPQRLLPQSAQSSRAGHQTTICLGAAVQPWLYKKLKEINEKRRALRTPFQCSVLLQEILRRHTAEWLLASMILPTMQPTRDRESKIHATGRYEMIKVTAYVVYVDILTRHEIAFKVLPDTRDQLVRMHRMMCFAYDTTVACDAVFDDIAYSSSRNDQFARAMETCIFYASVPALEAMDFQGSGELLNADQIGARNAILDIMFRFLPTAQAPILDTSSVLSIYLGDTTLGT